MNEKENVFYKEKPPLYLVVGRNNLSKENFGRRIHVDFLGSEWNSMKYNAQCGLLVSVKNLVVRKKLYFSYYFSYFHFHLDISE